MINRKVVSRSAPGGVVPTADCFLMSCRQHTLANWDCKQQLIVFLPDAELARVSDRDETSCVGHMYNREHYTSVRRLLFDGNEFGKGTYDCSAEYICSIVSRVS